MAESYQQLWEYTEAEHSWLSTLIDQYADSPEGALVKLSRQRSLLGLNPPRIRERHLVTMTRRMSDARMERFRRERAELRKEQRRETDEFLGAAHTVAIETLRGNWGAADAAIDKLVGEREPEAKAS